ncbi:MAG TPA: hypothetical protein GXX37_13845 [Clostridiaceae bacterium]|nr:hypothetical protein [Clostridiaceae bacterium]
MWTQALEHFQQAISHKPANDIAFSNAGLIYKKMVKINEVFDCYRETTSVNPDNTISYNNIDIIYLDIMKMYGSIKAAKEGATKAAKGGFRIKLNMYQAINTLAQAYSLKITNKTMNHITEKSQKMQ